MHSTLPNNEGRKMSDGAVVETAVTQRLCGHPIVADRAGRERKRKRKRGRKKEREGKHDREG